MKNSRFVVLAEIVSSRWLLFASYTIIICSIIRGLIYTYESKNFPIAADTFDIDLRVAARLSLIGAFICMLLCEKIFPKLTLVSSPNLSLFSRKKILTLIFAAGIAVIYLRYINNALFGDGGFGRASYLALLIATICISIFQFREVLKKYARALLSGFLGLATLLLIMMPLIERAYINQESVIDNEIIISSQKEGSEKKGNLEKFYSLVINPNSNENQETILINFIEVDRNKLVEIEHLKKLAEINNRVDDILLPEILTDGEHTKLVTRLDGLNRKNICYFVSNEYLTKVKNVRQCTSEVLQLENYQDQLAFIDANVDLTYKDGLKGGIYKLINRENQAKALASQMDLKGAVLEPINTLLNSSVRGIFFHHYQAFIEKGFDLEMPSMINSQYGLGPIIFTRLIKNLFSFSAFDSILIGVIFSNLILFIYALSITIYIKSKEIESNPLIIIFGFFIYISYIWLTFNIVAPSLYSIRILPHLILLFGMPLIISGDWKKYSSIGILILYIFYVVSIFYNIDYGFMIFISGLISSLLIKRYKWAISFLIPVLAYLCLKYLLQEDNQPSKLLYYYLAGIGFSGAISPPFYIVAPVFLFLAYFLNNLNFDNLKQKFCINFVFYSACFSLLKGFWSTTLPQIASSFLLFYLFFYCLDLSKIKTFKISEASVKIAYPFKFFVVVSTLLLYFPLSAYQNFKYNNNYNIEYKKYPSLSIFWPSDVRVINKIEEIKNLIDIDDKEISIISNSDALYSLYFEKRIASPYTDLSTFLVSDADRLNASNYFRTSKVQYIILDKVLLDSQNSLMPYQNKFTKQYAISNLYNSKYYMHLSDLAQEMIQDPFYFRCDTSPHFIKLCRK